MEHAVQMENVFVNLDMMVQFVNHVYLVSPYKHRLSLIVLILDIGCKAGESLSCLNNGTCLDSGLRECPFGYNGVKCEKCN